jgi:hypothetical protein
LRETRQPSDPLDAAGGGSPVAGPADRRRRKERPRVGWIATIAIVLMLLLGAGWELWRWLLLIITMD